MMNGIALRRLHINGKKYAGGDKIALPADQFATFETLGFVQRAKPAKEIAE